MTIEQIRACCPKAVADVVEMALLWYHDGTRLNESGLMNVIAILAATPAPADPHAAARADERRKVLKMVRKILANHFYGFDSQLALDREFGK